MILLTKDHLTRDTKDKITSCYNKAVIKATSIYDLCYIDRYIYDIPFKIYTIYGHNK